MSLQLFSSTSQRKLQRPQLSQKHNVRINSSSQNNHRSPWHKLKNDDATDAQMQQCRRDQLDPLGSDAMFEVIEITDACFMHLLLQYAPYAVVNWI